jgi:hypothetical protein
MKRQQQIPFEDDNQKGDSNGNSLVAGEGVTSHPSQSA